MTLSKPVMWENPNPWGFFDMHGNVWEWTADAYQAGYPSGNPVIDPVRLGNSSSNRVKRGAGWGDGPGNLRSASRHNPHLAPYSHWLPHLPPKKPVMQEARRVLDQAAKNFLR